MTASKIYSVRSSRQNFVPDASAASKNPAASGRL
jgi:hypothetical protein